MTAPNSMDGFYVHPMITSRTGNLILYSNFNSIKNRYYFTPQISTQKRIFNHL
ncbi:hypothetical protein TRM7615_03288 [Falsiruegeria mediterranea M17]|uniref:Uncharacterized protein n=1 Tax=Falsiruegeria mediterranea M17 TaxID=1200281 RepID=A0A2R8CBK2_9RHOB|nr:hypothetical protein TRM7615_03288 [Falsiruegeria mediterranea M17]